jgi:DNA-binding transcriptional LysR family regulator
MIKTISINLYINAMRRLTLRQFRVFEAVARHLSFSRAAEELHLSQPAVSMQVRGIEVILGLPLTEQLGKKIFLTEAGREVLHASQAITARLDDLQANLAQLRGMESGRLNIAVTSTVTRRQRHPGALPQPPPRSVAPPRRLQPRVGARQLAPA